MVARMRADRLPTLGIMGTLLPHPRGGSCRRELQSLEDPKLVQREPDKQRTKHPRDRRGVPKIQEQVCVEEYLHPYGVRRLRGSSTGHYEDVLHRLERTDERTDEVDDNKRFDSG